MITIYWWGEHSLLMDGLVLLGWEHFCVTIPKSKKEYNKAKNKPKGYKNGCTTQRTRNDA
jgi:hypothetical protein